MIGVKVKTELELRRIQDAVNRTTFRSIRSAAFEISRDAKALIVKSRAASSPGDAPTTRGKGGKSLRGAIFVDADRESGVIGPRASFVGDVGEVLEFGGKRGSTVISERPFMIVALKANVDRFAEEWSGSVGV